ncbi:toll/interleukin-1 receptor domain-containing protein [bacterium]
MAEKSCDLIIPLEKREFHVFISYAKPDIEIAKKLAGLFKLIDLKVHVAKYEVIKMEDRNWRAGIIKNIKNSCCFIPIYTPNSINRPWVLFETGAAESACLQIIPSRVQGISEKDLMNLPNFGDNYYELYEIDNLKGICIKAVMSKGKTSLSNAKIKVNTVFNDNTEYLDSLIKIAKTRWVFIAGNKPNVISSNISRNTFKNNMKSFIEALTIKLIKAGFSITACPHVEDVGANVLKTAIPLLDTERERNKIKSYVDYQIGGIYPIDKIPNDLGLSQSSKDRWKEHMLDFRMSYLVNQEYLIIVGGNSGTDEEYQAAEHVKNTGISNIKIFAVKCFGGTAQKIFNKLSDEEKGSCSGCNKYAPEKCDYIPEIIKMISGKDN